MPKIQSLRQAGYTISQIADHLGHHWETVRKYYEAPSFPERKQRRPGRSILDPFLPYLQQRFQEGCENALQLWREIQQRGYPGSSRQVLKWMQLQRTCTCTLDHQTVSALGFPAHSSSKAASILKTDGLVVGL